MRKLRNLLLFLLVSVMCGNTLAQPNWNTPLPTDPKVIVGKLDNGMTYYIRQNSEPKERAEFYIVFNVGAMLEDDSQDGLAHFTEHMAFNGTQNFPGKGILNYLETIGVKFGQNVNAFTAQDITAYNLSNVPLTRESIIDSALLILHDWAHYIAFEEKEIDAERGVIREEWRTRRTFDWRAYQARMQLLYEGSKYAERDVIGSLDVINNFEYETIRRFYNDWYRADLQAIIIVGDFDPQKMENKVKALFSEIQVPENAKPRPEFDVPDHAEPRVGIFTDPEATRTMVELYFKHPATKKEDKNTLGNYKDGLIESLYANMFNARFDELRQQENPPFVFAYNYFGELVRTKNAYITMANARENSAKQALQSMLEENFRIFQHGFTQTELDRAKADMLRSFENSYKERDKQKSGSLVREYMSNFTDGEAIPGIEFEYMFSQSLIPSITVEEVSAKAKEWITNNNMVFFISAPEKEAASLPSKDEVLAIYNKVKESKLEPYADKVSNEPLISKAPKAGKITKTSENKTLGVTEWTLSNGAKVIIKSTDFKEDEVLFSAYSPGGYSLVADSDVPTANLTTSIAQMSGIGNFSKVELDKMLAGKLVRVGPYLSEYEEGLTGSSSPQDIELMMQLAHLNFTQPRFDQTAYNTLMTQLQAVLQNAGKNPNMVFRDSATFLMSNRHYRERPINIELLKEVDFAKMESIYKNRFADASDFTFVFVGNIAPETLKPLVETYLASLPNIKRKENWKNNNILFPKGVNVKSFSIPMQVPKSTCLIAYQNAADVNYQNILATDAINHILDLRYTETIREAEGGTYGVSSNIRITKYPINQVQVIINFDTDPAKADKLISIAKTEFEKIATQGPSETDLSKAREFFIKNRGEKLRENRFWSSAIKDFYANGIDIITQYNEQVRKLSTTEVQKVAQKLFNNANRIELTMSPEE